MARQTPHKSTSMRLSPVGSALLDSFAADLGVSKTAALEVILREYAGIKGVHVARPKSAEQDEAEYRQSAFAASMKAAEDRYGVEDDYDNL